MTAPARIEPQLEPALTFVEEGHRYFLDFANPGAENHGPDCPTCEEKPSATTILSFGLDRSRIPKWTADRGTALHLATEFYDENDLDPESVDPFVKPHLDAYVEWYRKHKPTYLATEEKVWGEVDGMLYCGTVDRVMQHPRGHHVVVDLKSGAPRSEHGLQLAAYKHAVMQRYPHLTDVSCMGLYCLKDGTWQEKNYDGVHLLAGFKAKLEQWYEAQEKA